MIFLDSDDWLEDNAVEVLLAAQLQYPDKLIASGMYFANFGDDGRIYRARQKAGIRTQVVESVNEAIIHYWHYASCQSACYKIFKADIIHKYTIHFMEGVHNHEDGLFVFEYLHGTSGLVYIDEAVWTVLNRPGSAMRSDWSFKLAQSVITADNIMINHPSNTPEVKEFLIIGHAYITACHIGGAINTGAFEEAAYLKAYSKQYAKEFLRAANISVYQKVLFVIRVFFPSWVWRILSKAKNLLHVLFRKNNNIKNYELAAEWLQPS